MKTPVVLMLILIVSIIPDSLAAQSGPQSLRNSSDPATLTRAQFGPDGDRDGDGIRNADDPDSPCRFRARPPAGNASGTVFLGVDPGTRRNCYRSSKNTRGPLCGKGRGWMGRNGGVGGRGGRLRERCRDGSCLFPSPGTDPKNGRPTDPEPSGN